ncbi:MAG: S10 family peptidase [Candidatus Acidiferrales bacterium]
MKIMMERILSFGALALLVTLGQPAHVAAQEAAKDAKPAEAKSAEAKPGPEAPPKEESSVTEHTIKLGGQTISYKATASTTLLKDEKGEPTASIYSTAYTKNDVKDFSQRPIAFIYNGGPGSSSIWLHMGAFGPRRVVTADAAATPPAPYKVVDNADCILDKADLVFIDPVGTGFSRAVGKAQNKDFWGVDQDVRSLAQFITTYISRNNRWNSPKFLMGESYGTFRSAALADYLQTHARVYVNGIVLISSVLDLRTLGFLTGDDMSYIFYLPSYAASAWYYKVLRDRPENLEAFIAEARQYAAGDYAAALMKGSKLTDAEKSEVAKKLAHFTGLSEDYLTKANLRVNLAQFNAELERSRGLTIGRYDSRFSGPTYDLLTENAETDPSFSAVVGAFTAGFNSYVREELKYNPERNYETINGEIGRNWDWKHTASGQSFFPGAPNVEGDLIEAMIENPHLQVQVETGYFDMATPFFATEYTMDHLGLPEKLRGNIHIEYYTAGHMMYLHSDDLAKLKANVGGFIENTAKQ